MDENVIQIRVRKDGESYVSMADSWAKKIKFKGAYHKKEWYYAPSGERVSQRYELKKDTLLAITDKNHEGGFVPANALYRFMKTLSGQVGLSFVENGIQIDYGNGKAIFKYRMLHNIVDVVRIEFVDYKTGKIF